MRIRRPRGITVTQLMIVTAVGFLGGVYIWKPLIVKYTSENPASKSTKEDTTPTPSPPTVAVAENNTTPGLMVIGVGATIIMFTTYRFSFQPAMARRRRQEAESAAEFIFEHERLRVGRERTTDTSD